MAEPVDVTRKEGSVSDVVGKHSLRPDIATMWIEEAKKRAEEKKLVHEVKLPSGKIILAHRTHLRWLYKHGRIPDHLTARVEEMIRLLDMNDPNSAEKELTDMVNQDPTTELAKWRDVLNALWVSAVVFPAYTDNPDDEDNIEPPFWVGTVEYFDKLFLFQWAEGVDQSVEDFFREQATLMGMLADGEGVPLSATSDIRVDRFGRPLDGDSVRSGGVPVRSVHPGQDRGNVRKARRRRATAPPNGKN